MPLPFRITIGTKLLIALLLAGLLPVAISAWLTVGALYQVGDIATWESTAALEGQARDRARLLALEMARRDDLLQLVVEQRLGDHGYAFVVDNLGHLIAAPLEKLAELGVEEQADARPTGRPGELGVNLYQQGAPALRAGLTEILSVGSGLREVALAGETRYLTYARLPRTDWMLVLVLPASEVLQPVADTTERIEAARANLLTQLALSGAGVLAAVIVLASLAYRNLTGPIRRLTLGTRIIAAGNLSHRIPVTSSDEIGELATEFNVMTERLEELNVGLERKVADRTRELEQRTEETVLVLDVTRAVSSSLQLDRVLEIAAEGIASAVGGKNCGVYLLDEEQGELIPRPGVGATPSPEVYRAYVSTPIRPEAEPLLREVLAERRPIASSDARHDPRLTADLVERLRLGAVLAVPFVVKEQAVGLAVVTWFDETHDFTSEQMALGVCLS